jgi:hypothetical protein
LVLSLLHHCNRLIESITKRGGSSGATTKVGSLNYVNTHSSAQRQDYVCGQLDLDGTLVLSKARNAIEINEGSLLGAGLGYCNAALGRNDFVGVGHGDALRLYRYDDTTTSFVPLAVSSLQTLGKAD